MLARLLWLSIGTFLIGAESFVVAGVLPGIAHDVGSTLAACGQLVTAYALAYAIGSPILATTFSRLPRKPMLIAALVAFAIANALAAVAANLPLLMAARVLLGLSAGLFIPTANAVAVQMVPAEMRGRAIATVIGGMTVAVALGAPLGTLIATQTSWRVPFALIAAVSLLASLGLTIGMPGKMPVTSASLRQRLALAGEPRVLKTLLVTLFWAMSSFVLFVYIAPFLGRFGIHGWEVSGAFFLFGVASAAGNAYGGVIVDRVGSLRTLVAALSVMVLVMGAIGTVASLGTGVAEVVAVLALMVVWGAAGWAFYPAQSARLVEVAPGAAVVVLSLNSSALFFGQAGGAALGSLVQQALPLPDLAFAGAMSALIALGVLAWSQQALTARQARVPEPAE